MPNWVDNNIRISGAADKVRSLLAQISSGDTPVDFDKIKPIDKTKWRTKVWETPDGNRYNDRHLEVSDFEPVDSDEVNEKGDKFVGWSFNWYGAQCEEWGTKWGACDPTVDVLSDTAKDGKCIAEITFNTAWSAPEPVIERIAELADGLTMEYYATEESNAFFLNGNNFGGKFEISEIDSDDIFTAEAKERAVCERLSEDGKNPDDYDLQRLIDNVYFVLDECEYYAGFADPVLAVYDLPEDLETYKK